MKIDPILTNILGLYNTVYVSGIGDAIVIAPNTLIIDTANDQTRMVTKIIRSLMGGCGGEPMYIDTEHTYCDDIEGIICFDHDIDHVIYYPKMSFMYIVGGEGSDINYLLGKVVGIMMGKNYDIHRIMKEKALIFPYNGKWVKFPGKDVADVVVDDGVPKKALMMINRYMGRIYKYIISNIKFDEVKNIANIDKLKINVTVPIKKVVIPTNDGEFVYDIEPPIVLNGVLYISKYGVDADGDLRYHPNINYDTGSVCLGTLPPFDGTLKWVGRLLNTLMVARLDSCNHEYAGRFVIHYEYELPSDVVDTWEGICSDDEYPDEEYEDEEE